MDAAALLDRALWGNTVAQWVSAAGVGAGSMILLWALGRLVLQRLRAISARTVTDVDDLVAELLTKTNFLFVLLVGVWAGSLRLSLSATADRWIREILVVGLLLQGAFWATGVLHYFVEKYRSREMEVDPEAATAVGAVAFVGRVTIWSIFLLLALQNLGIDVTTLVASLGIGGIAVALALQNVLGDLFASLSIVLDKPFVVGDFIIVGDMMGTVEHVGLKTTRVRSLGGEQLVFSNSDLLGSRIRNYKRMQERRIVFSVGVTYDTGPDTLAEIPELIREIVQVQENTRFDRSHLKGFGDSALLFETVYYMLLPDYNVYMDTQQAINLAIYRHFEERGIDFAFPTRTLHHEDGVRVEEPGGASRPEPAAGNGSPSGAK